MGGSLDPHFQLQYLQRSANSGALKKEVGFIELDRRRNDVTTTRDWMAQFNWIVSKGTIPKARYYQSSF